MFVGFKRDRSYDPYEDQNIICSGIRVTFVALFQLAIQKVCALSQYQLVALLYILIQCWSALRIDINFLIKYPWFKQRHWVTNRSHRLWYCNSHFILECAADVTVILLFCAYVLSNTLNHWNVLFGLLVVATIKCVAQQFIVVSLELDFHRLVLAAFFLSVSLLFSLSFISFTYTSTSLVAYSSWHFLMRWLVLLVLYNIGNNGRLFIFLFKIFLTRWCACRF